MYGEYDAIIVYGVSDDFSRFIDEKWLSKNYPSIEIHALNIVRNYRCQPVYGIVCEFDTKTGVAIIDDKDKKLVDDFYKDFQEYHEKKQTRFY